MLILPMATVNAVDSNYPYVDKSPTILNQDVFKQAFSVDGVDRVAYNYQLTPLDGGMEALVAFQIKLVIDGVSYTTSAVGTVDAYELPESDILWEGPIDGEITINNIHFNIIIGFMQRASTQEVMVSVTLQNDDYDFMVISFGKNIMTGDVLDCINQRFGTPSSSESVSGTNGVQSGQLNINDGGNASTNAFDSDFSPITYPGSGGGLPGDGGGGGGSLDISTSTDTWKYQSRKTCSLTNAAYTAVQSRVYFESSKNLLMTTIRPYSSSISNYYQSIGYSTVSVDLHSFKIDLAINDASGSEYAHISGIDFPISPVNDTDVLLFDLVGNFIIALGAPSSLVNGIMSGMKGNIVTDVNPTHSYVSIKRGVGMVSQFNDLQQITTGIPIKFQLVKGSSAYVGNTPYTVTTTTKYWVVATPSDLTNSDTPFICTYIPYTTTHEGTVTLQ